MRALRRHHKKRMKAKARFIVGTIWKNNLLYNTPEAIVRQIEKCADNLKICSCEMCRNPRRSKWRRARGRTRKEIQAREVSE